LDEWEQCVRQVTITLSYFHYEVPVLYVGEGTRYIPMIALCEMLGLRADTHIPRWRKLLLWANARKLPLQTASGKRIVWCLQLGALPFWCACFTWSLVLPVRLEQLRQATDAWLEEVEQANQLMLDGYRSLRQYLYTFLAEYSDTKTWLDQLALCLPPSLDVASSLQLEELLSERHTLIDQATAHAGKMVQEMVVSSIVDIVTIEVNGAMTGIGTFPIFPVVPGVDCQQFFEYASNLSQWNQDMAAFTGKLVLAQDSDQSEEAW
jgi:hypothetical protein